MRSYARRARKSLRAIVVRLLMTCAGMWYLATLSIRSWTVGNYIPWKLRRLWDVDIEDRSFMHRWQREVNRRLRLALGGLVLFIGAWYLAADLMWYYVVRVYVPEPGSYLGSSAPRWYDLDSTSTATFLLSVLFGGYALVFLAASAIGVWWLGAWSTGSFELYVCINGRCKCSHHRTYTSRFIRQQMRGPGGRTVPVTWGTRRFWRG